MKQFLQGKYPVLIFSSMALLALLLLAVELKDVTFNPGQSVGRSESRAIQFAIEKTIAQFTEVPVWKQVILWLAIFLIVLLLSSLLSPELRKRLILGFVRLAAFVLIFLYIIKHNPGLFQGLFSAFQTGANPSTAEAAGNIPPPVFQPPQISSFLSYLISFGILLLIVAAFWGFYRWWTLKQAELVGQHSLEELAAAARASLDDLATGRDWDDAIIQCYSRMSRVVDVKRGLHRADAMTPTEFGKRLEQAGLPHDPVQRLTQLFEFVRYGSKRPEQDEIDDAKDCLTSILMYCGETV